jgi:hypothetical protein
MQTSKQTLEPQDEISGKKVPLSGLILNTKEHRA